MKKISINIALLAAILVPSFAYADELAVITSTSSSVEIMASTTQVMTFTTCSQEAIEKRDTSIAASRSAYNVTMTNALNERKNREKAAIALTVESEKKDAIKNSVDAYKNQVRVAQNTLTQLRKVAWQDFEDDIKECRTLETTAEATSTEEKPLGRAMMMKVEEAENKTIKETIKGKIETFFSLFN